MAELILGVDGGGSKTRALLAGCDGAILGVGTARSSNYQSVGWDAATSALRQAIDAALSHAGANDTIVAACFGLAGVDRPADRELYTAWVTRQAFAPRFTIVNDAELVLAAGTPTGWGVALICGTGSICYGRAPDGRTARAGGWGYLLGDEGSGYDIGVQALRLATQTADGRAQAHAVLSAILDHWQLTDASALIGHVYRPETTRAMIATLGGQIANLAAQGDSDAQAIMDRAALELGRLAAAVVRRLDLSEPPVACGGGLLVANAGLQQGIVAHAGVPLGPLRTVDDPARGALVIARRLLETPASR
ncbi:MAG TPA: BadF/BadG/BcrA/BcrD ATPase family protein [Herpetosiphonaceae bacterium]